jgi:hypothetical protein
MLIEDGKLLYLVSDDPELQKEMRKLESKYSGSPEAERLPLTPIEMPDTAPEPKINNTKLPDTIDVKSTMDQWNERTTEDKKKLIRTVISYIRSVKEDANLSYAEKINKFPKDIPDLVRPIYRDVVRGKGFKKLSDLLNDGSQDFESIFNEILERLRNMIKPYLN